MDGSEIIKEAMRKSSLNQCPEGLQCIEQKYPRLLGECLHGQQPQVTDQQRRLLSVVVLQFDLLWNQWREEARAKGLGPTTLLEIENILSVLRALA